jgi:hypothetical protein
MAPDLTASTREDFRPKVRYIPSETWASLDRPDLHRGWTIGHLSDRKCGRPVLQDYRCCSRRSAGDVMVALETVQPFNTAFFGENFTKCEKSGNRLTMCRDFWHLSLTELRNREGGPSVE